MGFLNGINKTVGNRVSGQLSAPKTDNLTKTKTIEPKQALLSFQNNNSIGRKELGNINPYSEISPSTIENKEIAQTTNDILKELGFKNYKVSGTQVASVTAGVNKTVLPGMQAAEDGAVAANLTSVPKGDLAGEEFSKLFAIG